MLLLCCRGYHICTTDSLCFFQCSYSETASTSRACSQQTCCRCAWSRATAEHVAAAASTSAPREGCSLCICGLAARRADALQHRLVMSKCAPGTRLGLLSLLAQLPTLAPGEAATAATASPGAPPAPRDPLDGGAHAPAPQRAWGRSGALAQPAGGSGGRGRSRLAEAGPRTDFEARPAYRSALHGLVSCDQPLTHCRSWS